MGVSLPMDHNIKGGQPPLTLGISSLDLVRKIPGAVYCPHLEGAAAQLADMAEPGDLILTVGAGDIYLAGEELVRR